MSDLRASDSIQQPRALPQLSPPGKPVSKCSPENNDMKCARTDVPLPKRHCRYRLKKKSIVMKYCTLSCSMFREPAAHRRGTMPRTIPVSKPVPFQRNGAIVSHIFLYSLVLQWVRQSLEGIVIATRVASC